MGEALLRNAKEQEKWKARQEREGKGRGAKITQAKEVCLLGRAAQLKQESLRSDDDAVKVNHAPVCCRAVPHGLVPLPIHL